jgi:hypothetical protein
LIRILLSENNSKFFFEPGISFSIMKKGILKTDYYDKQGFSSSTSQPYSQVHNFSLTAVQEWILTGFLYKQDLAAV